MDPNSVLGPMHAVRAGANFMQEQAHRSRATGLDTLGNDQLFASPAQELAHHNTAGRDVVQVHNAGSVIFLRHAEDLEYVKARTKATWKAIPARATLRALRDQTGAVRNQLEELDEALQLSEHKVNEDELESTKAAWLATMNEIRDKLIDKLESFDHEREQRWTESPEGQKEIVTLVKSVKVMQDKLQSLELQATSHDERIKKILAKRSEQSAASEDVIEAIDDDPEAWQKACELLLQNGYSQHILKTQEQEIKRLLKLHNKDDFQADRLQEQAAEYEIEEDTVPEWAYFAEEANEPGIETYDPLEPASSLVPNQTTLSASNCVSLRWQLNWVGSSILPDLAREGDAAAVRYVLECGVDVDAADKASWTALHYACKLDHVSIAEALIEYHADINCKTAPSGYTPIFLAAYNNRTTLVRMLLAAGANTLLPTSTGTIPLHEAAFLGAQDIMTALLDDQPDALEARTNEGSTPLMRALWGIKPAESASYLINRNANKMAIDSKDRTTLHIAAYTGILDAVKLFQGERELLEKRDHQQFTPLITAVYKGRSDVVEYLIQQRARLDPIDIVGNHLYHNAAYSGSLETMIHLQRAGARVHVRNKAKYTPLHTAVIMNRLQAVKFLLGPDVRCNISVRDRQGFTPLLHAASMGYLRVVEELLHRGADLAARDRYQWTALHRAIQYKHASTAAYLISRGSEIEAKTANDLTPLHEACLSGSLEIVRMLIDNGASVAAVDTNGYMPMDYAISAGHTELVQLLAPLEAEALAQPLPGYATRTALDDTTMPTTDLTALTAQRSKSTSSFARGVLYWPTALGVHGMSYAAIGMTAMLTLATGRFTNLHYIWWMKK